MSKAFYFPEIDILTFSGNDITSSSSEGGGIVLPDDEW